MAKSKTATLRELRKAAMPGPVKAQTYPGYFGVTGALSGSSIRCLGSKREENQAFIVAAFNLLAEGGETAAEKAVAHIVRRMRADGRLAYLLGYGSESFDLLTEAYAEQQGIDLDVFRQQFHALLNYTPVTEAAE
ncbi:MAG: hypothetical protein HYU74_12525 [Dechloromonas sp.]|nr:hypothetical protein [Dechloromonas sp.]